MTELTSNPFETVIPQHIFLEINLSHIISGINETPSKFLHMTIVTPFSNLPILLAPFEFLATSTSSQTYSLVRQRDSSSIPTTSSQPITYVPTSIFSPPSSYVSTPSTRIPSIIM